MAGQTSDINVFVRVVEAGGFSAAARALGMTPSAVSKQIARLEDRLDARLLQRTTRRLSLTEAGEAFFRHGARIVADIAEAERAVTQLGEVPRGTLRVNAAVTFGHHQIEKLLPEFLEKYPEVQVDLTLSDSYVNLVEEEVDVAIRAGPLLDSTLIVRKLGEFDRMIVAAPAYLARHGRPAKPEDLVRHNCVLMAHQPQLGRWPFALAGARRTVEVRGNATSNNGEAVFNLVLAGLGVARLAEFVVGPAVRDGRLVRLFEEFHHPDPLPVAAVYLSRKHLSPKVRAFVDFLAGKFLPKPPWAG